MTQETQKILVSINPGQETGWAFSDPRGKVTCGVAYFYRGVLDSREKRLFMFSDFLTSMQKEIGPFDTICTEKTSTPENEEQARIEEMFQEIQTEWCSSNSCRNILYPTEEIWKFYTDSGPGSFFEVKKALYRLGHSCRIVAEVRALAVLYFARSEMKPGSSDV